METRTININVTTDEVQNMANVFIHLKDTLGLIPEDERHCRLVESAAGMLIKVIDAHPDSEKLKELSANLGTEA